MPAPTMLWYDYETTGTDPVRDRPLQFAAIRTDMDLRIVGEPVVLYCTPAADSLPHPEACLITGIAPQDAARDGVIEAEFAATVHELLAQPGTCSAGYNSIRFDDEFNRHLFYRNFFDPYEHAWKNGNSRWDILDLARACHALRPAGIAWPEREDGAPSFKLEHLANSNHLGHQRAHDALSDAEATLALARLLREKQPRLYAWYLRLRNKKSAAAEITSRLPHMQPVLHVSSRYPAERGCLAMVAPITEHPDRAGTFIVADLDADPDTWANLDSGELLERMFTPRQDLPNDIERPPLKEVHSNKSPFLAPVKTLRDTDTARIGLDPDACMQNLDRLRACAGLADRVRHAFAAATSPWPEREDPECRLYAGFASDADRRRCGKVRATPPERLGGSDFGFDDSGFSELLFRFRARNWPGTLNSDERARWQAFACDKLTRETETTSLTLDQYFAAIDRLRAETPPGDKQALLDRLQDWGETRRAAFGI